MLRLTIRRSAAGRDRGVAAIVFAVAAPMLIGAVGLSIDSGNLVLQRANVQKASDSAALAIGQDCARATRTLATSTQKQRCTNAGALATAQLMNNANAPGATASIPGGVSAGSGTAKLQDAMSVPMRFAATLGVQPKTVTAASTVTWGQVPTAGSTIPMTLDVCDYNAWRLNPNSTHKLYRYDGDQDDRSSQTNQRSCAAPNGGTNTSIVGALWVVDHASTSFDASRCLASTALGDNNGKIYPQNWDFPSSCAARMNALVQGKTYLMAVGESIGWSGWGNGRWPNVKGYAPFVFTGWRFGDKNSVAAVKVDPAAPSCTGKCRGIQGYFTGSVVQLEGVDSYGVNPGADFGAIRVKLTG